MSKPLTSNSSILVVRVLAWVLVVWVAVMVIVASWTHRTIVPMPANDQFVLLQKLKQAQKEQEPGSIAKIQKLRAKLILDYLNRGQLVKGRQELLTYTNWLDNGRDLPLTDRIEMRRNLAIIYLSLQELDPALKQYDIIINELSQPTGTSNNTLPQAPTTDDDPMLLKARMLNDRGVANYLFAQSFEKNAQVKIYLTRSANDFKECKELLDQLSIIHPGREKKREDLMSILEANQKFYSHDLIFTPLTARP